MNWSRERQPREDGPRGGRSFIGVRLRASGIAWLDEIAEATGSNRTEIIRACIALGRARKKELITLVKDMRDQA